ncbi:MAG: hypothetical protein NTV95_01685 [Candidatus Saccharibacteria bacterium]|nr:hypothetical protein [Candidatus Saccharibacteria bacterium]
MTKKTKVQKETKKSLAEERKLINSRWGTKEKRFYTRWANHLRLEKPRYWFKERSIFQKIMLIFLSILIFLVGCMYGIAQWYIASNKSQEFKFGATFIPSYARYFGLEPKDTLQAMIDELGIRHYRFVSYWDEIEKTPGVYDFEELDWQFEKARASNSTVTLAIGLRQPRWPECHMPTWASSQPKDVWYPELKTFMTKVIERYKDVPFLESYQLENEFFLDVFGICPDFSRDRLIDEYNLVKSLDPNRTLIISRSNNALGLPVGKPRPDKFAISVYKRVWDRTVTKRYFEYPFPAWFYGFLAGAGKILTGKDMIIHELQAEPWGPDLGIPEMSIEEQNKSLNARRLTDRIAYGKATGMREVDLWGVETWYWRKVKLNDPSLWEAGKKAIDDQQCRACYK